MTPGSNYLLHCSGSIGQHGVCWIWLNVSCTGWRKLISYHFQWSNNRSCNRRGPQVQQDFPHNVHKLQHDLRESWRHFLDGGWRLIDRCDAHACSHIAYSSHRCQAARSMADSSWHLCDVMAGALISPMHYGLLSLRYYTGETVLTLYIYINTHYGDST